MQMWELFWVYDLNKHSQGNSSSRASHFTRKNFGCYHHGRFPSPSGTSTAKTKAMHHVSNPAFKPSRAGNVYFYDFWKKWEKHMKTTFLFHTSYMVALLYFLQPRQHRRLRMPGERTSNPPLHGKHHFAFCSTNVAPLGSLRCKG